MNENIGMEYFGMEVSAAIVRQLDDATLHNLLVLLDAKYDLALDIRLMQEIYAAQPQSPIFNPQPALHCWACGKDIIGVVSGLTEGDFVDCPHCSVKNALHVEEDGTWFAMDDYYAHDEREVEPEFNNWNCWNCDKPIESNELKLIGDWIECPHCGKANLVSSGRDGAIFLAESEEDESETE